MNYKRRKKGFFLILMFLGIGLVGGVLFFPINFNNQYTCLYHRILALEHHQGLSNESRLIGTGTPVGKNHESEFNEMTHSELVQKYILPFGLMWWVSLIVIALAFFWLKHRKFENESQTTIEFRKPLNEE